LRESEDLKNLLSFENKIMSKTAHEGHNLKKKNSKDSKDLRPEVLRARMALKLGNPFRGA
jgi:hypothetical protein